MKQENHTGASVVEHQPRERSVPCAGCGFTFDRSGIPVPRTMTWAISALCPKHEKQEKAA